MILNSIDPLVPVDVLDIAHRAIDAGIVDENIEPRKFFAERFKNQVDILRLADIADNRDDAGIRQQAAARALLLVGKLVCAARAEQHAGAIGHVVPRDLGPQPLAGAGDQRKAALELHRTLPATMYPDRRSSANCFAANAF